MSLTITFYGRQTYKWQGSSSFPTRLWDAWFYRPDHHSTGGIGFKVPFLHVCWTWGECDDRGRRVR